MFENNKKVTPLVIAISVFVLAVLFLVLVGVAIYVFDVDNFVTRKTAKIFPYPVAIVNRTHFIGLNDMQNDLQSIRRFYENQDFSETGMRVDFTTEGGQKRLKIKEKNLLNKLIENQIIEMLAQEKGIKITPEVATTAVERKLQELGGDKEATIASLQNLYGWTLADFEKKIVIPDMYRSELEKNVKENNINTVRAKEKINQALAEISGGADFAMMAQKYSDGESAKSGGELGWLTMDQMIPEIAMTTLTLEKGGRSGIIESMLGYHIIEVVDKSTENGLDKVKLRQIFVRAENFSDWLQEQEKNIKINIPLKDYFWDSSMQAVEFSGSEMRDFENNLEKNSPGDISVLF